VFKPDTNGLRAVFEGNLCLRIYLDREVRLNVIGLTRMGKEIATILPPVDPRAVFAKLATVLHGEVKSMDVCQILEENLGYVRLSDPIEILKPATADCT